MTGVAAEPLATRDEVEQQLSDALIEIRDRVEQRRAIRNATETSVAATRGERREATPRHGEPPLKEPDPNYLTEEPRNMTTSRTEYTAGLRALADLLDQHDEFPLPTDGSTSPLDWWVWDSDNEDSRSTFAAIVRALPGTKTRQSARAGRRPGSPSQHNYTA